MIYTVYQTTCIVNAKVYIGVHKTDNPQDGYLGSGHAIKAAIVKYGQESFIKEILFLTEDRDEAYAKEKEIVNRDFVNSPDTYNLVGGGSVTVEVYPNRKILRGEDHPMFGKKQTPEIIEKRIAKLRGRKQPAELIAKRAESRKGKPSSLKGRSLTPEDKAKKSEGALKREKIDCPHCHKITDPGNFSLYHGDNCKSSPLFSEAIASNRSISRKGKRNHATRTCPHCMVSGKGGNMTRSHFDNCKKK